MYFTRDYAPWSGALETRVKNACEKAGATCHRYGGSLLHEPESIKNGSGEPYKVYTPYSRACFASGEPKLPATAKVVTWLAPGAPGMKTVSGIGFTPEAVLHFYPGWGYDEAPGTNVTNADIGLGAMDKTGAGGRSKLEPCTT